MLQRKLPELSEGVRAGRFLRARVHVYTCHVGSEARHRRAKWRRPQDCGAESRLGPPTRCGALGTLPVLSVSHLEKEEDTSSVSRGLNN